VDAAALDLDQLPAAGGASHLAVTRHGAGS
jgi:hypothetical protein